MNIYYLCCIILCCATRVTDFFVICYCVYCYCWNCQFKPHSHLTAAQNWNF